MFIRNDLMNLSFIFDHLKALTVSDLSGDVRIITRHSESGCCHLEVYSSPHLVQYNTATLNTLCEHVKTLL